MLPYDQLWKSLNDIGVGDWRVRIEAVLHLRLSRTGHGDFGKWEETLTQLGQLSPDDSEQVRKLLLTLSPWRKGPFDVAGVHIDSEWRSDLKWERLADSVTPLAGRTVLDVGCGNGYYARRMCDAGARLVIGVDPTLLYVIQHLAIDRFERHDNLFVLPLRSDELPPGARVFDTCFSMGVLYHQRSPLLHLQELRSFLRRGGELVLETIYIPGEESYACTPTDRYARMRNVWLLPTITELTTWLHRSGFKNIEIIDKSITTTDEQRSTEWMRFDSLDKALDPENPEQTVEGWPAPRRVVVIANAP
jgi:tRNA (mo5U34)-methyltransferase